MMIKRIIQFWVYGGVLAALVLVSLTHTISSDWPTWRVAVWWMLPLYMLHQWEEHDDDRFRSFVNAVLAHGSEALTPLAVFVINVPGVWGVIAGSFIACGKSKPGFGLIAVYLVLVNAMAHLVGAIALHRYNPGLWSALVGFLPAGIWALLTIQHQGPSMWFHLLGFGIAAVIHCGILIFVLVRQADE